MNKLKEELKEKINNYYPKHIDGLDNNYSNTPEFKKLSEHCKKYIEINDNKWTEFEEILQIIFKNKIVLGKTNYFLKQPSFSVQISDYSNNTCVNIYLSFIIPYFYISELKYKNNTWVESCINPYNVFKIEKNKIEKILNDKFNSVMFPKEILETKILNTSFDNIKTGDFNFKNAFFNKKNLVI